jgi:DNA-binding LacI/PurR family transcriptional regulator
MPPRKNSPLYLRLKDQLEADLKTARAAGAGARLPTLNELQAKYGASRPTISKALAALAAEGTLVKQAGRGGFVHAPPVPISVRTAPSGPPRATIGFICPLYGAELPQSCFRGIDRTARRRGFRVLMAGAGESEPHERAAVQELIAAGVQGLIIYPTLRSNLTDPNDYLFQKDLGVPLVLVDTCFPEQGHAQVVFDNRRGSYQLAKWLLNQGRRRVALLTYANWRRHPALVARRRGYQDALGDFGLPRADDILEIAKADLYDGLDPLLDRLLAGETPVDAIMATNDIMAMELLDRLLRRGVKYPEDVSVTGFDYTTTTCRYRPTFTTTEPDFGIMGEVAGELLIDSLESGTFPAQTYILPVSLRVRHGDESS